MGIRSNEDREKMAEGAPAAYCTHACSHKTDFLKLWAVHTTRNGGSHCRTSLPCLGCPLLLVTRENSGPRKENAYLPIGSTFLHYATSLPQAQRLRIRTTYYCITLRLAALSTQGFTRLLQITSRLNSQAECKVHS